MKRGGQFIVGISALIIAGLAMSATSFAHPGFGPARLGMMRRMGPPLVEQLTLSGDQRAQLDIIFASGRETLRPLAQILREKAAALRESTRTQPFDEILVRSQAQEIADLQAQLIVARSQMINQVLSVLTDEQKTRLGELRVQRLQQFQEWRKQRLGKFEQSQN